MSTVDIAERPVVPWQQISRSFARAEWIKLRTVRSTLITLVVAAVSAIGLGAWACERFAQEYAGIHNPVAHAAFIRGFDPTSQSLLGNALAQLAIGTLGVLIVTSEFGTGMIRASLAAMPQRGGWIAAKLCVFGLVAGLVGQVLTFTSFGIGQVFLGHQHIGASLGDPGVLRAVIATGIYVALIGLLGATLGLIIKHTAGAISTLLGILFVVPILLGALPVHLQDQVARFLPENIGEQVATASQLSDRFPPWGGVALMAGYVAALFAVGLILLRRRDA